MTFDRDVGVAEFLRKEARKFTPLPVRDNRRRGESVLPVSSGGGTGTGAFVHLTRTATQSISTAGEAISWDALGLQGISGFTETVPTTTVTVEQAGYYNIAVQLGWSSFTGGGTITILKNDLTVWPPSDDPGLWSSTDGQLFEGTAHSIECIPGDTLSVNVNPDDASAQTLASATFTAYLVDRAANQGRYRELVMSHEPIAYWRLGEPSGTNAADETGTHDALYTNTPTQGVPGVMQDGSGNFAVDVVSPEHVLGQDWPTMDFDSGPFTVEAWFNADAITGTTSIIIQKRTGAGTGWEMGVINTDIFFSGNGSTGTIRSTAPSVDTDYHVVATSDETTERLYVNGVEVDSDTAMSITANTEVVSIAYDVASSGFALDGTVDEVALYDRELTAAEIADHYRVGTGG